MEDKELIAALSKPRNEEEAKKIADSLPEIPKDQTVAISIPKKTKPPNKIT